MALAILLQAAAAGCGLPGSRARMPAAAPATGTATAGPAAATATGTVAGATYGAGETLGALTVAQVIDPAVVPLQLAAAPVGLAAVQFVTDRTGWVAGSRCGADGACQGVVLRTQDGGASWSAPAVLGSAITGLQFLDTEHGWAFGPSAVYATHDGGASWSALALPPGLGRVAGLQASFVDPSRGWLIVHLQSCATQGCGVRVYETADGGASWRLIAGDGPPAAGPAGLGWAEYVAGGDLGGGRGWMLAQTPAAVIEGTADGGRTWTAKGLNPGGPPVGGSFAGNGTGWVAATTAGGPPAAQVWESTDAAGAWRLVATVPGRVAGLFAAADGASAWLALQPADGGAGTSVSVVSALGTATPPAPVPGYRILAISALDGSTAWAVASGASGDAVLATTNGGRAWKPVYQAGKTATPDRLWGFTDAGAGWAVGSSTDPAALLRSADGGASWTPAGRVPVAEPAFAGFTSPQDGWVADLQSIFVTADGGASWSPVPHPGGAIAAVGFTTARDGWLLPEATKAQPAPELLVTHDGGASWQGTGTGPFLGVAFASPALGWALGRGTDGHVHLLATTDGGHAWTEVADLGPQQWDTAGPAPLWVGAQLAAAAPDDVWLASGQHLLQSVDGGHTWVDLRGPAVDRLAPAAGGLLWVGAGTAIYDVTEAGARWTQVGWVSGR